MWKRRSKYGNKWTSCKQGHKHQSAHEAWHCNDLELLKKGGVIKNHETQVKFVLLGFNGQKICNHFVDFVVHLKDGTKEIHECKSKITAKERDWINKMKMFKDQFPEIPYIVIGNRWEGK